MTGTREKTGQGKKTERKRTTAGRREVAPPWSIAISDQPPGRWWQGGMKRKLKMMILTG